jgi:hypothetical protein
VPYREIVSPLRGADDFSCLLRYQRHVSECKNPDSLTTFNACHYVDILIMHLHVPRNQQLLLFPLLTRDLVFFTNNLHMLFYAELCVWLQRELRFVKSYGNNVSFLLFVITRVLWKLNKRVSILYKVWSQKVHLRVTLIIILLVSILFCLCSSTEHVTLQKMLLT